MPQKRYQFVKPDGWRIIKPERYRDFSILSTELVPCIYGFAIEKNEGFDVVSMFDYGESSGEFIAELNEELNRLELNNRDVKGVNDYIKENAADYAVSETSSMKPVYHKAVKIYGKNVFVNIMDVATNIGRSYSLQLFVKLDRNLVCFGTSVPKLDTSRPMESAVESYKFVNELVNTVIKTLDVAK